MLIKSITLTKKYTIYIYIYELIQIIYGITFGNIGFVWIELIVAETEN